MTFGICRIRKCIVFWGSLYLRLSICYVCRIKRALLPLQCSTFSSVQYRRANLSCTSTKHILRLFESFKYGKGEKMANMRQQSKGREKERDILGDTPPQFWLLSRRNFGYFPAVWLISRLAVHFPTRFWLMSPRWLISRLILWLMTRPAVDVAPCCWFHAFLTFFYFRV